MDYKLMAQTICSSSVADGTIDMLNVQDIALARECLAFEQAHMNRVSMLKVIKRRMGQLEIKRSMTQPGTN